MWAALYRVLSGGVEKADLTVLYAYRVSHCPRRRGEILGMWREGDWDGDEEEEEMMEEREEMGEEMVMRVEMERLGIENGEGEMGRIDEVMRG